jgi:hypothetical protein
LLRELVLHGAQVLEIQFEEFAIS